MQAEIISIGSELTQGDTINTNAAFIASQLQELGIESPFQATVEDNIEHIHQVLNQALQRANLIITTGGLGPTDDDLTREAISTFLKIKLVKDKTALKQIQNKLYLRGYKKISKINIKQAYKPKSTRWMLNKRGIANGIIWELRSSTKTNKKIILSFPGVPQELHQMWEDTAKSYLKKINKGIYFYSKVLNYSGISESTLAERIKKYFSLRNPVVAPYVSLGEVKIKITAKASSKNKAKNIALATARKIKFKTKKYCFGEDNQLLEELVAKLLIKKKKTLSVAESCTGGLLSKRLTDIPGSSKYIKLNVVTYSNEAKKNILKVPEKLINNYGAVSPQAASYMATGIKNLAKTNIGVSITGIAGPTGSSKTKPIGLVYFGLVKGNKVQVQKKLFNPHMERGQIRWLSTQFILNWLRKELMH